MIDFLFGYLLLYRAKPLTQLVTGGSPARILSNRGGLVSA